MDSRRIYAGRRTVVLLDGVQLVWDTLRETFTTTLENGMAQTDPKSLALAVVVLLFLMYKK